PTSTDTKPRKHETTKARNHFVKTFWFRGFVVSCVRNEADHLIASGLIGDPTAPVIGSGGATKKNSYTPSRAQSSARSSRKKISPIVNPMFGMHTWWSGWNESAISFGRTSMPHVSLATAAI